MSNQLIIDYKIKLVNGNQLSIAGSVRPRDLETIKANKPEIINISLTNQKMALEKEQNIKNIEGLQELKQAIGEWENYRYQNEKRFDNERTSSFGIKKPTSNLEELKTKYPRVIAYYEIDKDEVMKVLEN